MNEVTKFMFYIYNRWNEYEAAKVFGDDLGAHIWSKWLDRTDSLLWYSELDNECKQKLVDRANELYD